MTNAGTCITVEECRLQGLCQNPWKYYSNTIGYQHAQKTILRDTVVVSFCCDPERDFFQTFHIPVSQWNLTNQDWLIILVNKYCKNYLPTRINVVPSLRKISTKLLDLVVQYILLKIFCNWEPVKIIQFIKFCSISTMKVTNVWLHE